MEEGGVGEYARDEVEHIGWLVEGRLGRNRGMVKWKSASKDGSNQQVEPHGRSCEPRLW